MNAVFDRPLLVSYLLIAWFLAYGLGLSWIKSLVLTIGAVGLAALMTYLERPAPPQNTQ